MKGVLNIDLVIKHNCGRNSHTIAKGTEIHIECKGPYINIVHDDNNFRLPASYLNSITILESI